MFVRSGLTHWVMLLSAGILVQISAYSWANFTHCGCRAPLRTHRAPIKDKASQAGWQDKPNPRPGLKSKAILSPFGGLSLTEDTS